MLLIGTAHVSLRSPEDVQRVIAAVRPDCVVCDSTHSLGYLPLACPYLSVHGHAVPHAATHGGQRIYPSNLNLHLPTHRPRFGLMATKAVDVCVPMRAP